MKTKDEEKDIFTKNMRSKKKVMRYALSMRTCMKGFSMIEVMIAMVMLLIGILGVIGMQYYAVSGNAFSREMRVALTLAEQAHEQMKATPYANLVSAIDAPIVDPVMTGGVTYTRTWWVQPDCASAILTADNNTCALLASACDPAYTIGAANTISAIKIRTCWTDKNGDIHSITLDGQRLNEDYL